MYTALDVAAWFLSAIDRKAGDSLTHLKLQKLVYYAQAWSLALLDRPLFEEPVRAWRHGPAVDSVYREFARFGRESLPPRRPKARLDAASVVLLEDILAVYGERSAHSLRDLTHQEEPWSATREGLAPDSGSRRVIPPSLMRRFYRRQFERRGERTMKIDLTAMRLEPLEEGLVALPPLPGGAAHFPADHAEYVAQVNADLGARRHRRPVLPPA